MSKSSDAMQLLGKHFDTAFAAPDGIKKLRELILTLAMQGKLVPQNANDQPASELLKEIEAEKKRLVKEGKFKAQNPLPEIKPEEVPYELPMGWEWVRLGGVGIIGSSSRVHQKDWTNKGIPFFRAREIVKLSKFGTVDNDLFITEELFHTLSESGTVPEPDDLMITGVGTIGVPYVVKPTDEFYFKDASVLIFKNHFRSFSQFIYHFLKSPYWINNIHSKSMGTTVHTLTISRANEILFPLPPLAEQRRIVAKIDQLMIRCDELEKLRTEHCQKRIAAHTAALNRLLTATESGTFSATWDFITQNFGELYSVKENVAELRKAILQLAVMGKLVPQNANDQPAGELLKEIESEKKQLVNAGKIKASKPLPAIKPAEVPYELPRGWVWVRMGEVGDTNIGLTYTPSDISDTGTPVLRSNNVQEGKLDLTDLKRVNAKIKDTVLVKEGDLLICARNGSKALVGKTALVTGLSEEMAFGAFMAIFRSRVNEYLLHFINSPLFRKMIDDVNTMTINQITQGNLRSTIFPLPPFAEQRRIVAKIDQLMALCDELEKQIDATTGKQTALLNAIMAQV